MKTGFVALIVWLLATPVSASAAEPVPIGVEVMAPGVTVPKTLFTDQNGIPATLGNFKGKTVVLNVWATWCGPCIKEMPSLDRLAAKLDRNKAIVLAVSQDKGGTAIAKPFLDKLHIKNLPAYADPSGKLSRDLGIRGLPTTFIILPTGIIVGRIEGPLEWDSLEIARYVTSVGR
jgi:thiol-disulfide isomerase/thioredoxin